MGNRRVPNFIKATKYLEGRIAVQATWGERCEVNSGGAVTQINNSKDLEQISTAANYLKCEEIDIIDAIDNPGENRETTTIIKYESEI